MARRTKEEAQQTRCHIMSTALNLFCQQGLAKTNLTDIAKALHLSVKTVSTHKSRIQDKLQLPTMAGLIRYGLEHHIGDRESGFDIEGTLEPIAAPGSTAGLPSGKPDT